MASESPLYYESNAEEASYLARRDPALGQIMAAVGPIRRRIWPEPYSALLRAIIGQQISAKAQHSIWLRFCAAFPHFDAAHLAQIPSERICQCGISRPKAGYIQGIAREFAAGRLTADSLNKMGDDQLEQTLGTLKGIGSWTVEMLLIFTFRRPNVLSFGDAAIRRSLCRLYGHKQITRELFQRYHNLYAPCATLAGMYLWEMPRLEAMAAKVRSRLP